MNKDSGRRNAKLVATLRAVIDNPAPRISSTEQNVKEDILKIHRQAIIVTMSALAPIADEKQTRPVLPIAQNGPTVPAADKDIAIAIVGEHRHEIDPAVEARVVRKIDRFLVPAMFIGYGLVYYDKVHFNTLGLSIANSRRQF